MNSIVLKTFKGGNISPLNDALLWQTAIPGAGLLKGCDVTVARGSTIHISHGYGLIKGRFFEVYENEVSVNLAETGHTLQGRIHFHMDLSNADEPIKIVAETGEELTPLVIDENVNYTDSVYDLEIARFTVDAASVLDLTQVFPILEGGSGGGGGTGRGGIARNTVYEVGDIATSQNAPGWCILVCIERGTTDSTEPKGYGLITKAGDKVLDGDCVFIARDLIGELDNITLLQDDISEIQNIVERLNSDTSAVVIRALTLDEYRNLETYQANAVYYCYKSAEDHQIIAIYMGEHAVYASSVTVTYHVDTGNTLTKTYGLKEDAIAGAPEAFLSGYEFVGWREDTQADRTVLSDRILMDDTPVDLYAVFQEPITVHFDANGGEGEIEDAQAGSLYNNGSKQGSSIRLPSTGFTNEGYSLLYWRTGKEAGTVYQKGENASLTSDTTLYAIWLKERYVFEYTSGTADFSAPLAGVYKITLYGGSGGSIIDQEGKKSAQGGLGGRTVGYRNMKQGDSFIMCVGGKGTDGKFVSGTVNGGYNGGASSNWGNSLGGGGGGGATHIAAVGGTLNVIGKKGSNNVFLVAGGGGGASYNVSTKAAADGGGGGGKYGVSGKTPEGNEGASGGDPATMSVQNPRFGYGMSPYNSNGSCGAGGSGYIGGSATNGGGYFFGAGGGCGFIHTSWATAECDGETYAAYTEASVHEGDGQIVIELVRAI